MKAPDKIYFPADGLPAYIDWDGSPIRTKQVEDSDVCYVRKDAIKDLALTWEDIRKIVVLFSEVSFECFDTKSANEMCEETLTRFKQYKEASND